MALNTNGTNRDQLVELDPTDRERLINQGVLVGDPRRWRPRWFDGRFLAASDLQAEQSYFLVRQSDLGRAAGSGVVEGLMVAAIEPSGDAPHQLRIEPGHGVTDSGELVTLFDELAINPADVPEMRRLDAAFGLQVVPHEPGHNRTGLYVLALRPVEWTAHPVGAYPTSLSGPRTVEDGTIVEGVAVSLIPYPDAGNDETWERRRARVVREVFVEGRDRGLDSGVLPLAMIALRGNLVEWVDPFLVRRETGAERPAGMDFGFGARALREAHLLQYQQHLSDALNAHPDQAFAATSAFGALPPVGRFPSGTIDADRLTQRFFPAGIEVELSFVPVDELPAIIEESLLLPPIDLTLKIEQARGTGVVVLVPLTRAEFAANRAALPNWDADPPALRPGFLQLQARATPKELLLSHLFRPISLPAPVPEEEPWRQLLRVALSEPLLWYVRRRHLPIPANVAAVPVDATSERVSDAGRLADAIRADPRLREGFDRLRAVNAPEAELLSRRLAASNILSQPALLRSLVARAAGTSDEPPTMSNVISALEPAADPQLGNGINRLSAANTALGRRLNTKAVENTGLLPEVDRLAREVPEDRLSAFSAELVAAIGTRGNPPADLSARLASLHNRFVTS
jgi:hypothetical protein